ncbi:putative protein [Human gemycircularvirus GeTz1]|uniref:Uncharacterized protein n=1 Tax=Human gemycircularvirus GeTz1 TaxID=1792832 RepID=A0A125R3J9_9VIRU|nr:putative protein [Human gemycircularvirus GeTz1]AMD08883.1 putative protein [Human gemycircularvirus GeTz1]
MSCLPTPNVETSTHGLSLTTYRRHELSASWEEKFIAMAEFTSTVLQTLENDSVRGTQKYSMWEDTIRTPALARAGLGLDMIMQSKMEMLSLKDLVAPEEMGTRRSFQQMLRDGLKLWLQKVQKSFWSTIGGDWILVRWYDPSHNAEQYAEHRYRPLSGNLQNSPTGVLFGTFKSGGTQ